MTDTAHLLAITEAARRLGIGKTKLYELLADGQLETVHVGKRRLVVAESVAAYVERLRGGAA